MNKRPSITAFDKFIESCGQQPKPKKLQNKETKQPPKFHPSELPFKNKNFQHSTCLKSNKKKSAKGLRQIAASERMRCDAEAPTYLSIDSPPCLQPAKKYSDVSGQLAKYTDPETGLHFSSSQEYKQIKRLPNDIVNGYLSLRNANRN